MAGLLSSTTALGVCASARTATVSRCAPSGGPRGTSPQATCRTSRSGPSSSRRPDTMRASALRSTATAWRGLQKVAVSSRPVKSLPLLGCAAYRRRRALAPCSAVARRQRHAHCARAPAPTAHWPAPSAPPPAPAAPRPPSKSASSITAPCGAARRPESHATPRAPAPRLPSHPRCRRRRPRQCHPHRRRHRHPCRPLCRRRLARRRRRRIPRWRAVRTRSAPISRETAAQPPAASCSHAAGRHRRPLAAPTHAAPTSLATAARRPRVCSSTAASGHRGRAATTRACTQTISTVTTAVPVRNTPAALRAPIAPTVAIGAPRRPPGLPQTRPTSQRPPHRLRP